MNSRLINHQIKLKKPTQKELIDKKIDFLIKKLFFANIRSLWEYLQEHTDLTSPENAANTFDLLEKNQNKIIDVQHAIFELNRNRSLNTKENIRLVIENVQYGKELSDLFLHMSCRMFILSLKPFITLPLFNQDFFDLIIKNIHSIKAILTIFELLHEVLTNDVFFYTTIINVIEQGYAKPFADILTQLKDEKFHKDANALVTNIFLIAKDPSLLPEISTNLKNERFYDRVAFKFDSYSERITKINNIIKNAYWKKDIKIILAFGIFTNQSPNTAIQETFKTQIADPNVISQIVVKQFL